MTNTYEEKEIAFGRFYCKSKLDLYITLAFIREKMEPNTALSGLWLEIMESALRTFGSENKQALLKNKQIDKIYCEVVDNVRHMVVVIDGIHHSFSFYTLCGCKFEKSHILERKAQLRNLGQKPYKIITMQS